MNEKILELLKLLSIQKKNNNERFKHLAILKALSILKKYKNLSFKKGLL